MSEDIDATIEFALYLQRGGFKVYLNKKNNWGFPAFHAEGTAGSKTELLVIYPKYEDLVYGSGLDDIPPAMPTCFAVELKSGEHLSDVTGAVRQLGRYWSRWVSEQVVYSTDRGVVRHINWFLLATRYSLGGFLWKDEVRTAPSTWEWYTQAFQQADYPTSKVFESFVFQEKQWRLDEAREYATRCGHALSAIPDMGVLNRGITIDGKLTDDLVAILPHNVVPVGKRPSGDAA
jgi:hypothetical protein